MQLESPSPSNTDIEFYLFLSALLGRFPRSFVGGRLLSVWCGTVRLNEGKEWQLNRRHSHNVLQLAVYLYQLMPTQDLSGSAKMPIIPLQLLLALHRYAVILLLYSLIEQNYELIDCFATDKYYNLAILSFANIFAKRTRPCIIA